MGEGDTLEQVYWADALLDRLHELKREDVPVFTSA